MHKSQTGSAMIEGLTAITVFSLGILGVVGLQASVLENNAQSQFRAEASYLAQEIIGLASADAANATCYTVNPAAGACTNPAADAAVEDWQGRVLETLPGADVELPKVELDADGNFTVTLQWKRQTDDTWNNYVATTNIQ
jgi:type IV pilus assembly protein PilV